MVSSKAGSQFLTMSAGNIESHFVDAVEEAEIEEFYKRFTFTC